MALTDVVLEAFSNLSKMFTVADLGNLELDYVDSYVFSRTGYHVDDETIKSLWLSYRSRRRVYDRRQAGLSVGNGATPACRS